MLKGKGTLLPAQKAFLDIFSKQPDQSQFYFTGGAALSEFYLGHRLSYDLDFFTDQPGLIQPFSYQIEDTCKKLGAKLSIVRRFETFVQLRGAFQFWGNLSGQRPVRFAKPDRSAPNLKYTPNLVLSTKGIL